MNLLIYKGNNIHTYMYTDILAYYDIDWCICDKVMACTSVGVRRRRRRRRNQKHNTPEIFKFRGYNNHPAYGLIAHVVVNTYVTWARKYVTWARMSMFVMVWVSREAIWRVIYILRLCKLHVINCNYVAGYWDTASVQNFCN